MAVLESMTWDEFLDDGFSRAAASAWNNREETYEYFMRIWKRKEPPLAVILCVFNKEVQPISFMETSRIIQSCSQLGLTFQCLLALKQGVVLATTDENYFDKLWILRMSIND